MSTFAYTALEASGRKRTGVIDAPDQDSAIAKVGEQGRFVIEIREARAGESGAKQPVRKGRVNRGDLALFTRRMADLADAGMPLDRALQIVSEQSESAFLSQIALDALADVRTGLPVSQALAKHPKLFPPVYTETLRAGEASGQFPQVASRLADFQEREVTRRSQLTSALVYPALLTATALFVIIFLLTFVLPRLSGVFKDMGTNLPGTTKFLLASTDFLTQNGLFIIGAIVGLFVLYRGWSATPAGATQRDALLMRLPLAGKVVTKAVVSRYARVLGTLLYGGVSILEAIRLAGLASGNRFLETRSDVVANDVREGVPLHTAMRDSGAFPPVLTHMVAIGEETGDLPTMLGRVSDSLDFEVDTGLRRLTALAEPLIVVTMGGFVGFVVLSVLLPIFEAQSLVK